MDINKLYRYITTFNLINITIKNMAINTRRLWRRPVLGQSEIINTVAILDVQANTAISLCRERSVARRRALAFRRGALGRAARAHIVERTSDLPVFVSTRIVGDDYFACTPEPGEISLLSYEISFKNL